MKEVIFSEGGMPLALDDLALMQGNSKGLFHLIIEGLVGKRNDVFTFSLPDITTFYDKENTRYVTHVKAGEAYIKGNVVSWQDTKLAVDGLKKSIYIVVREELSDERIFEDGQSRASRKEYKVSLSASGGGENTYDLTNMPTFKDLVSENQKTGDWEDYKREANFDAGYSGFFGLRVINDVIHIKLDLTSKDARWGRDLPGIDTKEQYVILESAVFGDDDITEGIEVKHPITNVLLGKLKTSIYNSLVFVPKNEQLKPYQCPIKIEFTI